MRRPVRITLWIADPFVFLVALFLLVRFVIYDLDAKPFCHKQMTLALRLWQHEQTTKTFPMAEQLAGAAKLVFPNYHYVPGLREDDPQDLVLFYFNRPTRWRTHVKPEAKWTSKTWIVVPADSFAGHYGDEAMKRIGFGPQQIRAYGEESESLTTEQFTNRLIATLDFLRTNNRPYWRAVVKEHSAFIESITKK